MTEQRVQGLQAASHPPVVSSSPGAEGRLQAIQEEFNSPLQGRETFPVQELEVLRWVFTWRGQPSCCNPYPRVMQAEKICRLKRRVDEELQEFKHPDLFQLALVHLLMANMGDRRPKALKSHY